ncbi:LysM peptidoglycan-binding domain-containing protein [Phycisphaera mikurensis]|uniref:LysM domain-containing protein n=1 Tax=Phycisphaera mikurensis (strain NBRC 102666 / KCTC 22515 / FYK2301M01) TaxID=1142394 RepID=I0II86_PHYMF|nr:LysM peptidoglycan-binding domain-containing protein [Phycisphaera mikurensis]MBB6442463.1 nucleoid-associated protein YgaU [Phycisphaera mikurensis]BAM04974.1 hypothetical protein PSMK_28150 [Phycisphaera mikurensis NBRC 102666]
MPASRLLPAVLVAFSAAAGCVAPPREKAPVEPIQPRPLVSVALPPVEDGRSAAGAGSAAFAGPEAMAPAPVGPAGGLYTVAKGDTLMGIARRQYGSETKWRDIAAANPGIDPGRLNVGQTLVLP